MANCYTAIEQGVEVVPVLNKIDLPSGGARARDPARSRTSSASRRQDAMRASAKTGEGVRRDPGGGHPPHSGTPGRSGRAAQGAHHRLVVRQLRRRRHAGARRRRRAQAEGPDPAHVDRTRSYLCEQVGVFTPKAQGRDELAAGEVGFVIAGIKELKAAQVGDTVTHVERPAAGSRCPGSRRSSRRCSPASTRSSPTSTKRCATRCRSCKLNDSSLHYEPEVFAGARFRLPLRLPRPAAHGHRAGAARARVRHGPDHDRADGHVRGAHAATARRSEIENPAKLPIRRRSRRSASRSSRVTILVPQDYVGAVITLCNQQARRAEEHAVRTGGR